jgi:LacI family transcriptional regulator
MLLHIAYDGNDEQTVEAIRMMIESDPELDALFFTTNYLGVAGLEALRVSGRRIAEDIGIICFDDSIIFRLGSPSISVIAQPIREMGRQAVRLIIDMIAKKPLEDRKLMMAPVVIERESTRDIY